ncbi:caspase family protein [Labrys sp. 22185]|uniref:caspase family protein n=1 Tax=Labrys sp. 22185 TaxID=3453888 RepID=UPI003F841493
MTLTVGRSSAIAQQAAWSDCKSAQNAEAKISACSRAISTLRDKSQLERAYLRRGNAYMEQRQFALAVSDFTKIIALHPGVAGYYDDRQAAYKGLGNFQAALNDANTAISLAPKLAFAYQSRGLLLDSVGQSQQALTDFNSIVSMEPRNPSFLNIRGETLVKLGRAGEALSDFNNALIFDAAAVYVLKGRAKANAQLGNMQAALSDIRNFMQAYPTDIDAPGIQAAIQGAASPVQAATRGDQSGSLAPARVTGSVTKANVLATFCRPADIESDNCKVARGYPSEDTDTTCNVELNGGIFEQRYGGQTIVYASYRSDCEPHATNYGGSVLLERKGSSINLISFVRGDSVGENCAKVAGDYDTDSLYCISQYDGMGEHSTTLASYSPARQNADNYNAIDTASVISANTHYENDPVDCSKRVVYLEVGKVRPGPKDQTLLVDVKYADNEMIKAACASGGYKPTGDDTVPKGSVFLAPGKAKKEPFVYDIQSREFLPLRRNLDDGASPKPSTPVVATAPVSENRVALVIGNSAYKNVPALPNPQEDASAVAEKFKALGFKTVTLVTNASQAEMMSALSDFSDVANQADWAVIYFAGHGLEVDGRNYLVPVDASLKTDRQVALQAISLDQMMGAINGAKKLRLVLLDACRDDPFLKQMTFASAKRSMFRGLARVEPETGTLVAYAARDGAVAADGNAGSHSPFTTALLDNIGTPGVELNLMLRKVRDDVMRATDNEQEPFNYGSLPGQEYYFSRR